SSPGGLLVSPLPSGFACKMYWFKQPMGKPRICQRPTNSIITGLERTPEQQRFDSSISSCTRKTDLGFIERMFGNAGTVSVRTEPAFARHIFKPITVVARGLSLSQSEDVSQAKRQRDESNSKRDGQRQFEDDEQKEEEGDGSADAAHEPPEKTAFQTPGAA